MSKFLIFLFTGVVIIAAVGFVAASRVSQEMPNETNQPYKLIVGESSVFVGVAQTAASRGKGLSGREMLPSDEGLLFVFDTDDTHAIWMKDMRFPIDIIWIDKFFSVVAVVENATPDSFPEIFEPKNSARYVLEVNAGWVARNGIIRGNAVEGLRAVR